MSAAAAAAVATTSAAVGKETTTTAPPPKHDPVLNPSMDGGQECPIFLRKTYHMIDTCDPTIAGWSDDGETFVVKRVEEFEKTIIPQFFKHNKFSSFVRQLNFYRFRKVRYADTIRIDAQLEAETANYWRFRHEKFRRGHPELLHEIKRSNGQQQQQQQSQATNQQTSSNKSVVPSTTDAHLQSEVTTLKKRIEAMSKNIDELTSLVQKVSIQQEEGKQEKEQQQLQQQVGNKRKKVELVKEQDICPDKAVSNPTAGVAAMELEQEGEFPLLPASLFSLPSTPEPLERRESSSSELSCGDLSDNAFVDQLFTAFEKDELLDDELAAAGSSLTTTVSPPLVDHSSSNPNAPDATLMKSLSDALSLLPRDMQELIVNRLVATITGTEFLEKHALKENDDEEEEVPTQVPPSPKLESSTDSGKNPTDVTLGLAAATLAAILSRYGAADCKHLVQKALPPVIPIHA